MITRLDSEYAADDPYEGFVRVSSWLTPREASSAGKGPALWGLLVGNHSL
jgi:hypothetical protein